MAVEAAADAAGSSGRKLDSPGGGGLQTWAGVVIRDGLTSSSQAR